MASDLDHRTDRLAILAAMIMLNPAAAVSKGLAANQLPPAADITRQMLRAGSCTRPDTCTAAKSLDHLVGEGENFVRYIDSERLRCLQVDCHLELGRLHDGQVGGPLALQDSTSVNSDLAVCVGKACAVTDQAPSRDELALRVDRGNPMACRQRNELTAPRQEERVGIDEERGGAPFAKRRKDRVDLRLAPCLHKADRLSKRACRVLELRHIDIGIRIVRIYQYCDRCVRGKQLLHQLEALGPKQRGVQPKSGDVAAGLIEAGDEAELDRITAAGEHDRYRRGRRFGRRYRRITTLRHDECHMTAHEVCRQCGKPVVIAFCPAVFDRDILALGGAGFLQTFVERRYEMCIRTGRSAVEIADHRHRLLPARHERTHRRAAEEREELAPLHYPIPSFGAPRHDSGIVMPSALLNLRSIYKLGQDARTLREGSL